MTQLLEKDKRRRLGARRDAEEIKEHEFFRSINWTDLESKSISPPFNPNVVSSFSSLESQTLFHYDRYGVEKNDDTFLLRDLDYKYFLISK